MSDIRIVASTIEEFNAKYREYPSGVIVLDGADPLAPVGLVDCDTTTWFSIERARAIHADLGAAIRDFEAQQESSARLAAEVR